jgi:hypothetical protein
MGRKEAFIMDRQRRELRATPALNIFDPGWSHKIVACLPAPVAEIDSSLHCPQ